MSHAPFAAETLHHEQRNECTISNGHDAPRSAVSVHHPVRRIHISHKIVPIIKKYSEKFRPILDTHVSGSPIIQDGKLVGAVTHVLVNDPTTGYGIFIENMLDAAA